MNGFFSKINFFLRIEALASKAVETRRNPSICVELRGSWWYAWDHGLLNFFGVRLIFLFFFQASVLASRFLISSSASSVRALQLWFVAMAPKKKTTGPTLTPEYVADAWLCVS